MMFLKSWMGDQPKSGRKPSQRVHTAWMVALLVAAAWYAGAHAASRIALKAASFDPLSEAPPDLSAAVPDGPVLDMKGGRGAVYILQFHDGPTPKQQRSLEQRGLVVLDYVPEHSLIVRAPQGTEREDLSSYPGIRAAVSFQNGFKVSADLRRFLEGGEPRSGWEPEVLVVTTFKDTDMESLRERLTATFPSVTIELVFPLPPVWQFRLRAPSEEFRSLVGALASHPDVAFEDLYWPPRLENDQAVWTGQSYDRLCGPDEAASPDPKPYTGSATVWNHGILGEGQIIGITDTHLEFGMCQFADPMVMVERQSVFPPAEIAVNPEHRKVIAVNAPGGASSYNTSNNDCWRHGTHVSGSALGDSFVNLAAPGTAGHDTGDGIAPLAKLVFEEVGESWAVSYPETDLLEQQYDAGVRIASFSWDMGSGFGWSTWVHEDFLIACAAGNDGPAPMTLGSSDKNALVVGASENYDASFQDVFGILDPENMAGFSSEGPTLDGRIKPDVVTPGEFVLSSKFPHIYEPDPAACDYSDPNVCYAGVGCYIVDPTETCATGSLLGTSMATPLAAGLAALVREYFMDGYYPSGAAGVTDARAPSAALVKAILINGARNMRGRNLRWMGSTAPRADYGPLLDAPSMKQGWGRVTLDDALYFTGDGRKLWVADVPNEAGIFAGEREWYLVEVESSEAEALKLTLVWTDPPAAALSAVALRNDLDLVVTAPDGVTYRGNQWTADDPAVPGDKRSTANPAGRDSLNNVEGVLIPNPPAGVYRVEVLGANIPGYFGMDSQGYALAVTSGGTLTGERCTTAPPPSAFDATVIRFDDVELTWSPVPDARGYRILRNSVSCESSPSVVFDVGCDATSYHDRTTVASSTYYYTIRAVMSDEGCETKSSDCATVTTPPPPVIQGVNPTIGVNNDPTPLAISGLNFRETPRVYLGTATEPEKIELTPVEFVSSTLLNVVVPVNLQSLSYDVRVVNPDTLQGTKAGCFTMGAPLQQTAAYTADFGVLGASDYTVSVVDAEDGVLAAAIHLGAGAGPLDVAVRADGTLGVAPYWWSGFPNYHVGVFHPPTRSVLKRIATPLGYRGTGVVIHPAGNTAFFVMHDSLYPSGYWLRALDLETFVWGASLRLGQTETAIFTDDIVISPDGSKVFVTNIYDSPHTVVAVRVSDLVEIGRVPVGQDPRGLAISQNGKRLYVANSGSLSVSVIDTEGSPFLIRTIDFSTRIPLVEPKSLALSAGDSLLHAAHYGSYARGIVTVDLASDQFVRFFGDGSNWSKIVYWPDTDMLYALNTNGYSEQLAVFMPSTLTKVAEVTVGDMPVELAVLSPTPLTLDSVLPSSGGRVGGTLVTLRGSGYQGLVRGDDGAIIQEATRVFFGNVEASSVTLIGSSEIRAVTPAHAPGFVDVEVRNPNGRSATLVDAFRYLNSKRP